MLKEANLNHIVFNLTGNIIINVQRFNLCRIKWIIELVSGSGSSLCWPLEGSIVTNKDVRQDKTLHLLFSTAVMPDEIPC